MTLHLSNINRDERIIKMTAKRDGECAECETELFEGDTIYWDTKEYKAYCETCGENL